MKAWKKCGDADPTRSHPPGPLQRKVWEPLLYGVIFYVIVKVSFLFSVCG